MSIRSHNVCMVAMVRAHLCLGDLADSERLEPNTCIVRARLDHTRVHHILDAVDGDRGLGDVGGENDLVTLHIRRYYAHITIHITIHIT